MFSELISIRIAIASGVAFFIAQNLDVGIFDKLRKIDIDDSYPKFITQNKEKFSDYPSNRKAIIPFIL